MLGGGSRRRRLLAPPPAWRPTARAAPLLAALGTALVAFACGHGSGERADRVVLVTVDTLRADHVGCYGASAAHTPSLDALAADGVRFATALSPAPITLPSHTTILTGMDPPRHGVRNNSTFRLPAEIPTLAERAHDAGLATAAFVGAVVLDRQHGLDQGFDVYDDRMSLRRAAGEDSFSERTADEVVDAALAWLETAPSRFLLWIHLYDPHGSYRPPPGFAAAFPGDPYAGEIAFADAEIGRLLAALRTRFDDGRTLVLMTSDHGESLGEHGEITHSLTLYDATQHVPLLVAGPGVPRGRVVDAPVGLVDVAPTLVAALELEPLPDAQGRDLRSLWSGGESAADRRVFYMETLATQIEFGWSPLLAMRSARFKYIRAPRPELYDLRDDPGETRNRIADLPGPAAELARALDARLAAGAAVAPSVAPDADTRRRLESLGYVVQSPGDRERLGEVGGIDPKDALPSVERLLRALNLLRVQRFDEALAELAPVDDHGYLVEITRSDAALGAGRAQDAERYARAALARAPDRVSVHLALGRALLALGRLDEAQRVFEGAGALDDAAAEAWVGLGRVAEARGDREAAEQRYREAMERRGGSAEAHWRLAALRLEAGDVEGADALLAGVPERALEEPESARRVARAEARAGLRERAEGRLRAAARSHPAARGLEASEVLGPSAPGAGAAAAADGSAASEAATSAAPTSTAPTSTAPTSGGS